MAAAVAITPASGSITAKMTACRVNVTGAEDNDAATFNASNSPSEDAIVYYLKATAAAQLDLNSPRFTPSSDGKYEWNSLIFPAAGTWHLTLRTNAGAIVTGTGIDVTVS